tara:strand:- start:1007 stop:1966 length:960 start_codon:yes stop_codon:yes gene_type:complete
MKNIYSLIFATFLISGINAQDCSDIFISEYVEGSHMNKAIELYNPTNKSIELSDYSLHRYSNGGQTPSSTQLGGVIQPYSTYVIVVDKRDPNGTGTNVPVWNGYWNPVDALNTDTEYDITEDLQSLADTFINEDYEVANTMYFNGNDAIVLENLGNPIDVFGKIGENPGEAWSDENGTWWTIDQTLIRKSSVTGGFLYNPMEPFTFDPTLEWDSLPINTFSELGQHVCVCSENTSIIEHENLISIYPNPNSSGILNIQSSSGIKEIKIINLIGQNVFFNTFQGSVSNEILTIDPSLNGIYFMAVRFEDNKSILKKIILK